MARRRNRVAFDADAGADSLCLVHLREAWSRHEQLAAERAMLPEKDPLAAAAYKGRASNCRQNVGHDYDADELEFMKALDKYKRRFQRPHPASCEVLAVLKHVCGYRKARKAK